MSFLTATNTELIYNMTGAGPDCTVSTAAFLTPNSGGTVAPAYLPPPFSIWQPSTILGKGFRCVFAGGYNFGGATNVTFKYAVDTTVGTLGTPGAIAQTGACAWSAGAAATGSFYGLIDIVFTAVSATTNNLSGFVSGYVVNGLGNNATTSSAVGTWLMGQGASGASATFTNWAAATANYFEIQVTASAAPTHFQLTEHQIFGLN